jgi:large subunit ribosomal protein L29
MKMKELTPLTELELNNRLTDSYQELFNLRFQKATGQVKNTSRVREVKLTIARIRTLLRQRELSGPTS